MFQLLTSCLLLFVFLLAPVAGKADETSLTLQQQFARIEDEYPGRLGVFALNTKTGAVVQYWANERFPFCSTFKLMLVSAILKKDDGQLLDKMIPIQQYDIVSWSPVTGGQVGSALSVRELCAAAMIHSDNTAANLLMRELGGPEAVNMFARSIGDKWFNLTRWETELNSAIPGDDRDTTTPKAMLQSMRALVLGDVLSEDKRALLQSWLKDCATGDDGVRAGVPAGWVVGSKTGSGYFGTSNEIAVVWPPGREPILVAVYFTQFEENAPLNKAVIAEVTKLVVGRLYY